MLCLAIAIVATGCSPVPIAASKGLIKLLSYLGVYALLCKLLLSNDRWWDRLVAGLLSGGLLSSVLALRQLYASSEELAGWADPEFHQRWHDSDLWPPGEPQPSGGLPAAADPLRSHRSAALAWCGSPVVCRHHAWCSREQPRCSPTAEAAGWAWWQPSAVLLLLLLLRWTRHWPLVWRRLVPLAVLLVGAALLVVAATQIDPIRTRIASLLAGRGDSSNNFRINVWMAAIQMVQDRPWLGIGPGNAAFNSIYPLYQQPKFNALSAYSVPLEILVETGIPGLLACLGLLASSLRQGLKQLNADGPSALASIASLAAIAGLLMQGSTDTIFFRPEVQLIGWFALASLVSQSRKS